MIGTVVEANGAWLRVVLAAPPGNLLSVSVVDALREILASARNARGVKWLTIESSGRDFCFGADIREHLPDPMPRVLAETHRLLKDLLAFPAPTAALVNGRCLGGGFELALACDDVITAADALLGFPEIGLCAFPPAGAALLPLRVGSSRASRAIVTGEARPAQYWHDAGLLSLVAPHVKVIDAARSWFDRYFARQSAVALAHAAEAARLTLRSIAEPALDAAERQYLDRLLRTADAVEGVRAWLDKRPPRWRDL
ncbi:MAG TPA: enoyl-CoA hydratase/isomerase family protein [Vicinamibacterales bacterium]|nr:enoyl-CoA hydratase/isomerase family protein [Vicinamibacterales bacterium]